MKKRSVKLKPWNFPNLILKCFLFFMVLLYIQLCYLSLSPNLYGINMDKFAKARNTVTKTLYAKRGTIYDKDGNTLALNVYSYTVVAYLSPTLTTNSDNPKHVVDKKMTAEKLAPLIGMTTEYLERLLSTDAFQVELGPGGRGITELKKEEIEELELPGIGFIENKKRYYPNGNFASYVLGYAKQYDKTVEENGLKTIQSYIVGELGIESKYDDLLKGTNGSLRQQQDTRGYQIPDTKEYRTPALDGANIYLTLDSNIQRFAESAVKESGSTYHPEWLILTAMDAKNGKILGTASVPSFDPNLRDITNYENPLVSYVYEPGSTMKTYTYMCAMEKGTYKGDDTFLSGNIGIGENTVYDWNRKGWGTITFDKGYEYSSNVGITNILQRFIGRDDLKACLKKFGFGSTTGIELPREQAGDIVFHYPIEVANAGFGQGITTTQIQNLQALTMISNNGKMLKPHIIDKIVDPNTGEVTYKAKKEESKQLVKQSTVDKMKELMWNTIHGTDPGSTGYTYKIDGFDIIGKTGTAQIFDNQTGAYLSGKNDYIFSFAGMYPKEKPEIIIYGAMRRPSWGESKGLYTAVKSLMESIAKYKNMFGEKFDQDTIVTYILPSYISKNKDDVIKDLNHQKINPIVIGNGTKIIKQYPSRGATVMSGDKVILVTNDENKILPDMSGWSSGDAIHLFDLLDMEYEIEGHGYVTSQSISAGTIIHGKEKIKITLVDKYHIEEQKDTSS